jgi:asparagine synthase (glutamine-hydrolysing)
MCGISGIYRRGDAPIEEARLLAMRGDQTHRGPDAVGLHRGAHIGLAFNRLAIIDLSPAANQPMSAGDGSVWIVFNGEIYNFQDVRRALEAKGRTFMTRSDTEVILQGYMEWGIDVISRLNGMFALALWDARREVLYLVRDRVGKKPLFYRDSAGEVVFASEVRALLKGLESTPPVDPEALDAYLAFLSVPGDRSIFSGVRKVPPGAIVTCTKHDRRIDRYWRSSFRVKTRLGEGEALERLDELLTDATRIRMISDVPLGAFLSGGVDSSTVVALMSRLAGPVRTFSIGFSEESFDELPHARAVALACGTRHEELRVEPDAASILPRLVWHYGEPFADSSAVPTYYVAAAARRSVTVALNGDGGDEAFAGYPWHRSIRAAELYRRWTPVGLRRALMRPLARALAGVAGAPRRWRSVAQALEDPEGRSAAAAFWIWPGFRDFDRDRLYSSAFRAQLGASHPSAFSRGVYESADGPDDLDRALQVGLETYLPDDLLVKVDIASMANSLEARSPLLDYRVLEFAASLPTSLLVKSLRSKHLLKTYAARRLPRSAIYRRKQGFAIPLDSWLRGPLRRPLEFLLGHPRFRARGYFDTRAMRGLLERHLSGQDHGPKLWAVLWLELWFRMFVDGDLRRDDSLRDIG